MMTRSLMDDGSVQFVWSLVLAVGMTGVIVTVLAFEYLGGFIPCALCLLQREPYYAAIPVALIAALSSYMTWPGCVSRGLLAIVGLLMLYGLVLSAYHSGVEWQFWAGPTDCAAGAASVPTDVGSLLGDIDAQRAPSCDMAAGRFLGLSFAGWNVVATAVLAYGAFRAALAPAE